jgi:hypothetical protein
LKKEWFVNKNNRQEKPDNFKKEWLVNKKNLNKNKKNCKKKSKNHD